jgi:hypothetical protein
MRPLDNPFNATPGSEPPVLAGRDEERSAAQYSLNRTANGTPAQPIVFTGLRGMGKTVLLRRCIADAKEGGAIVISGEATRAEPLAVTLKRGLERAQHESASLQQKLKTGFDKVLAVLPKASYELPNDMGAVSLGGSHASDESPKELVSALEDLNDTVRNHGRYIVFAIDEIQDAPVDGLRDIVRFIHATAGTDQPAYLLAAGLPGTREHLHAVRTYTERWRYFRLELLNPEQTKGAIAIPAKAHGVMIDPLALDRLAEESAGYPFFIQEYASAAWLAHRGDKITTADIEHVVPGVRRILEDDFYDARFRHLTPRECAFVLALADLGPGPHVAGEVAAKFGVASQATSSIRNQLIKKDVIFSPGNSLVEFRIPLTERYVAQHRTALEARSQESTLRRQS